MIPISSASMRKTRELRPGDQIRYIGTLRRVVAIDSYAEPYAPGGMAVFVRTADGATIPATWESTFHIA